MACEFLKIFAVCLSSHLLSCLSSSVFMASVKVTLSSNVKRHNCGHWKINTDIRASKATCSKNLCLICLLKRTVTDSFDIQYGGWCKKKSRNRRDGCERAARACMGFCVCALFCFFLILTATACLHVTDGCCLFNNWSQSHWPTQLNPPQFHLTFSLFAENIEKTNK